MEKNNEEDPELISQILDEMQNEEQVNQPQEQIINEQPYDENEFEQYEEDYEEEGFEVEPKSLVQTMFDEFKLPLFALGLYIFFSMPQLEKGFYKIVPANLSGFKYLNMSLLFLRGLFFAGALYGVSKVI
jgi:hypothetical protein